MLTSTSTILVGKRRVEVARPVSIILSMKGFFVEAEKFDFEKDDWVSCEPKETNFFWVYKVYQDELTAIGLFMDSGSAVKFLWQAAHGKITPQPVVKRGLRNKEIPNIGKETW
jgi:hypothetical protein